MPYSFPSLYSHNFARVAAAVPHVRVAEPAFNATRTIAPSGPSGLVAAITSDRALAPAAAAMAPRIAAKRGPKTTNVRTTCMSPSSRTPAD